MPGFQCVLQLDMEQHAVHVLDVVQIFLVGNHCSERASLLALALGTPQASGRLSFEISVKAQAELWNPLRRIAQMQEIPHDLCVRMSRALIVKLGGICAQYELSTIRHWNGVT